MIAKKITSSLSFLFLVMLLGCSGDDTDINVLVNDIFINPNKSTIAVGETQQLSPAIAPTEATNQTVIWSSDNTSVATVSSTGLVTGVAIGTASISVSAKDGSNKIAQAAITVTSKILITSLAINPNQSAIDVGMTQQLSTGIAPADATNQAVAWSSSNTDIATVSASGLVTGVAAGTTTITVYTKDGSKKTAQASITVTSNKILITSLAVSPSKAGITLNETQQLSATIMPADATVQTLTWTSSNTNVATVSASGLVTGVTAGTATITVSSQDRSNKTGNHYCNSIR